MEYRKSFANKSGVDLTGKEGLLVKWDSGLDLCTAATDAAIGVITNGGATSSDIVMHGEVAVLLAGNVSIGTGVTATTAGKALAATTGNRKVVGLMVEAGVTGDFANAYFVGALPVIVDA